MNAGRPGDGRWLSATAGLLAAVLGIWAAAVLVLGSMDSPTARREAKYQAAERAVFYRLEPGEALRFDLAAQAKELRLVTHLVLPPGSTYSPERQFLYGVQLSFEQGPAPWTTALYTRTRQSKAGLDHGSWAQENAFAIEAGTQLTDGREFLVQVPQGAQERSGSIAVKYAGASGSLLVRVYGHYDRVQSLIVRAEQVRRAESRVERATAQPWEKLPLARQRELARVQWEALTAQGEVDRDYATFTLYRTDFRLPLVEVAEAAQTYLGPGAGVAVNVAGPVTPVLRLWRDEETPAPPEPPLTVQALSVDGTVQRWALPHPAAGSVDAHPLPLPEGLHTLELLNRGGSGLRYSLEGPATAWFAPPELRGSARGTVALLPDLQRSSAFVLGPACAPALLELEPTASPWGRLLRVEARTPISGAGAQRAEVTLSLFDARGRYLGDTRLQTGTEPAPFDAAELPLSLGRGLACAPEEPGAGGAPGMEATQRPMRTSLPASGRLFLPPGVRRVEVRANRPVLVDLSLYLPNPGAPVVGQPYGSLSPTPTRWTHAPQDRRDWHPLRPMNHPELSRQGALATLLQQVRLEPSGPEEVEAPVGEPVSLDPAGTPASLELFEPIRGVQEEETARSLFSLLTPGQAMRARFDARAPTRPELRLQLEDARGLGQSVEILVDGRVVRRQRLTATRTRALLPPVASGVREVVVRSEAPGLTAALNRAPAAGQEALAHRSRRVYRLGASGVRIPVRKRGLAAETLNIVVYTPEPTPEANSGLQISIDRGHPPRRTGVLVPRITRSVRTVELAPSARPAGRVAGRPGVRWYPRTVAVVLAEDLAPGTHWVEVRPTTATPLWSRFFVFDAARPDSGARQWNRPGWDPEDAP